MSNSASTLKRIAMNDFGNLLVTRDQGEPVRHELLALVDANVVIEIDLDGVEAFTPSFIDEVLGKLLVQIGIDRFKSQVQLRCTSADVKKLVNLVLSNRSRKNNQ